MGVPGGALPLAGAPCGAPLFPSIFQLLIDAFWTKLISRWVGGVVISRTCFCLGVLSHDPRGSDGHCQNVLFLKTHRCRQPIRTPGAERNHCRGFRWFFYTLFSHFRFPGWRVVFVLSGPRCHANRSERQRSADGSAKDRSKQSRGRDDLETKAATVAAYDMTSSQRDYHTDDDGKLTSSVKGGDQERRLLLAAQIGRARTREYETLRKWISPRFRERLVAALGTPISAFRPGFRSRNKGGRGVKAPGRGIFNLPYARDKLRDEHEGVLYLPDRLGAKYPRAEKVVHAWVKEQRSQAMRRRVTPKIVKARMRQAVKVSLFSLSPFLYIYI